MIRPSVFFRTRSLRGTPYEQYHFDGERVECECVIPNATLNGAPRMEPVRSWSAEEFIASDVNTFAKDKFLEHWKKGSYKKRGAKKSN